MKRFFCTLVIFFIFCLLPPSVVRAFSGGSGTSGSPWQIATVADLVEMGTYAGTSSSGKYFILTADIDLNVSPYNTGVGWISIGTVSQRFQGNLNGDSHVISNLFISTSSQYAGLFAHVLGATISNLGLTNVNVIGTHASGVIGALTGTGSLTSTNNYSTGVVSSSNSGGGLMGSFTGGVVSSSYSSAAVRGNGFGAGGLIGSATLGSIYSSYATGSVFGYQQVGGLIGSITGGVFVSSSYATGNITATASGGGFVGASYEAYIYSSYATGNATTSGANVGGFVGYSQGTTLANGTHVSSSYATGNVSGSSSCGGFNGNNLYMFVWDSYATGRVACTSASGGYVGTVSGTSLKNVYSTGVVTQAAGGGLIGSVGGGGVTTSSVYWDTETSGKSTSGGGATGKTTAQMKNQSSFAGWDFASIWNIDGVNNGGYPYLRIQSVSDVTSPSLSSFFPADNATTISSTVNLVLIFSEAVVPSTTGSIIIYNNNGSIFESIIASSSQVTGSGSSTIIINPSSALTSEASYYILISSTAFADASGNLYAGITSTNYWNFAVADEINPTASSTFPSDGATDATTTANLVINFSEAVLAQTGNIIIYKSADDSVFETISVTSSQVTGTGTTQIIINPSSDFAYQTSYYIFVAATAFDDVNGNSYVGISNSSTWNFIVVSDSSVPSSSASAGSAGTAMVYFAPAIGVGITDKEIGMYQTRNIGVIDVKGANILSYVGAQAIFSVHASKINASEEHELKINDVDTLRKKVVITISSEPKRLEINLNESVEVDLDEDSVSDIKVTFSSLWINRVEITILPLFKSRQEKTVLKNNFIFTRNLRTGMSGEDVRLLQIYLNKNGFILAKSGPGSNGKETMRFGMLTRKALINFQRKNKIYPVVGYFGPITRKVINTSSN